MKPKRLLLASAVTVRLAQTCMVIVVVVAIGLVTAMLSSVAHLLVGCVLTFLFFAWLEDWASTRKLEAAKLVEADRIRNKAADILYQELLERDRKEADSN